MPYLLFCELSVFDQGFSSGRQVFLTLTSAFKVSPSFSFHLSLQISWFIQGKPSLVPDLLVGMCLSIPCKSLLVN